MRTDHLAYQQATRVAGMGFLLQAAIGLIMLVYGFIFKDSAFQVASEPILVGTLVWIALVVFTVEALTHRRRQLALAAEASAV